MLDSCGAVSVLVVVNLSCSSTYDVASPLHCIAVMHPLLWLSNESQVGALWQSPVDAHALTTYCLVACSVSLAQPFCFLFLSESLNAGIAFAEPVLCTIFEQVDCATVPIATVHNTSLICCFALSHKHELSRLLQFASSSKPHHCA